MEEEHHMNKTLSTVLIAACALFASQAFAANAECEKNAVDKNGAPKSKWGRLDAARQAAMSAQARAEVLSAESAGQAGQVERLDATLRSQRALDRATATSIQIARTADDASLPLPDARAARLHDHDRQLCRIAPDLAGCPAASDATEPRDNAL
jgi:hypothetical protein